MTGNHPKRRKDKYNPYNICQTDGKYYISFRDGQGDLQELEISRELYAAFNNFELADLSHLNILDRHLEQSEVWENTLSVRAFHQPKTVEEIVLHNIQVEHLHTIRALCKANYISISQLENDLEFGTGLVSRWIKRFSIY